MAEQRDDSVRVRLQTSPIQKTDAIERATEPVHHLGSGFRRRQTWSDPALATRLQHGLCAASSDI